jgi:clan AA aspartic protease
MTIGRVDAYGRALVPITVRHPQTSSMISFDAWIDTGFTSALLLTPGQISTLGLQKSSTVPGVLAGGSQVVFDTYTCQVDWFGRRMDLEALECPGNFGLIGVRLLEDCTVVIDYPARILTISALPGLPSFP